MEVIHLNAEGLKKYCEVYGETIYNVSKDFKGIPEAWKMDTPEGVAEVHMLILCLIINGRCRFKFSTLNSCFLKLMTFSGVL